MPNTTSFSAETPGARVDGTITDRQITIPNIPPSGLMAIGNRTSFNFIKEAHNPASEYHYYDVVRSEGSAYIAIKPTVPKNTQLTDDNYWFHWSEPNAQYNELYDIVQTFNARIAAMEKTVQDFVSAHTYADIAANGFVYKREE